MNVEIRGEEGEQMADLPFK